MAGPYSYTNIKKLEPLVDARVADWLNRLRSEYAVKNKALDFTTWTV
jgi:hypothetical protein